MDEYIINIGPFLLCVVLLFAIVGLCFVFISIVNAFGRGYKDKLDLQKDIYNKNKDVEVVTDAFAKIGQITSGTKNEKILNAQNVENNKEIYAHDKKIDDIENRVEHLEYYINQINNDIQGQLKEILEKIK